MKSTSNLIRKVARELGEIRAFIRPLTYQLLALILVASIVTGTGIYLVIPITAHPQGLPGTIAGILARWCSSGAPCQFNQIYPSFSAFAVIVAMTITMLIIVMHMYTRRYQVDTDELHTLLCAALDSLDRLNFKIDPDEEMDPVVLKNRVECAGVKNDVAEAH